MSSSESQTDTSTEHETDGEPERTYKIEKTSQGKHYIEVPHIHMSAAGLEEGDTVGIKPINFNGKFALSLNTDSSIGLSRSLRKSRNKRPESLLTIPKRIATAAQLTDDEINYHSDNGRIVAILDHTPLITGQIDVYNVTEVMMSRWKSGIYAYQIPEDIYEKVQPGENVWFWYDVLAGGFVFVLEVDEEKAPDGAIELNVQFTEKAQSDYLVHLPKQICDGLELSGEFMKWAHDGERIMGMLQ